jgi:hypothetical protein
VYTLIQIWGTLKVFAKDYLENTFLPKNLMKPAKIGQK